MAEQSGLRWLMPIIGCVLVAIAGVGLTGFLNLVGAISIGATGPSLWFDYLLIGVALTALAFAGLSIIASWLSGRTRNIVPGPALYLFGLALATFGGEAAILGDLPVGLALVFVGLGIVWLEYRSDWL